MKQGRGIVGFLSCCLVSCLLQLATQASPFRIATTDELIEQLRQAVQNQYGVSAQNVLILWNDSLLEEKLAKLGQNLSVELTEQELLNLIGKSFLNLRVMDRSRFRAMVPISLKVDAWMNVYTTRKALRKGESLTVDSIQLSRKKLSELIGSNYLRDLHNPEDYKVSRDLPAGAVLSKNAIVAQALVTKGSTVRVVVVNENLRLVAQGEVLENGVRNQLVSVRVLNFNSNKVLQARVTGRGEVTLEISEEK